MYPHGVEKVEIVRKLPKPERVIEVHVPADPVEYGWFKWRLHVGYFLIKLASKILRFKLGVPETRRPR
jgi:hypothetical protein